MSMKGYGRLIRGFGDLAIWRFGDLSICQFGDLKMDIAVANVVIKNTKLEKIFHALVICSDCTLFYAKSP